MSKVEDLFTIANSDTKNNSNKSDSISTYGCGFNSSMGRLAYKSLVITRHKDAQPINNKHFYANAKKWQLGIYPSKIWRQDSKDLPRLESEGALGGLDKFSVEIDLHVMTNQKRCEIKNWDKLKTEAKEIFECICKNGPFKDSMMKDRYDKHNDKLVPNMNVLKECLENWISALMYDTSKEGNKNELFHGLSVLMCSLKEKEDKLILGGTNNSDILLVNNLRHTKSRKRRASGGNICTSAYENPNQHKSLKEELTRYFAYQRNRDSNKVSRKDDFCKTKKLDKDPNTSIILQGTTVQPRTIRSALVPGYIHTRVFSKKLIGNPKENLKKNMKDRPTNLHLEMGILRENVNSNFTGIFYYWGNRLIKRQEVPDATNESRKVIIQNKDKDPSESDIPSETENKKITTKFACWVELRGVNKDGSFEDAEKGYVSPNLCKTDFTDAELATIYSNKKTWLQHQDDICKEFREFCKKMSEFRMKGLLDEDKLSREDPGCVLLQCTSSDKVLHLTKDEHLRESDFL